MGCKELAELREEADNPVRLITRSVVDLQGLASRYVDMIRTIQSIYEGLGDLEHDESHDLDLAWQQLVRLRALLTEHEYRKALADTEFLWGLKYRKQASSKKEGSPCSKCGAYTWRLEKSDSLCLQCQLQVEVAAMLEKAH